MIRKLTGTVEDIEIGNIILNVNGVGYLLNITNETLQSLRLNETASLYTHLAVRENSMDLYGFRDKEELDFFTLLLTISGIGPKSAMGILNSATVETIKQGVASGDASHLTKVSGLGRKSAEKIIVALKDKIGSLDQYDTQNMHGGGVAVEALTSLGYSERDAREAISKIDKNLPTEEMIKQALKNINNA